jgi:hypothetical protein
LTALAQNPSACRDDDHCALSFSAKLPLHFGRTARSRKDTSPIQFDSPSSFGRTKIAKRRELLIRLPDRRAQPLPPSPLKRRRLDRSSTVCNVRAVFCAVRN